MLSFATLMELGLKEAGHEVRTLHPPIVFGKLGRSSRLQKWMAYVDKLVLLPPRLWRAARQADIVHICDHSNALYIPAVKRIPYVVTCHDLLAVRGGLGEQTDCPASAVGKWLQRWILSGLKRADGLACVSKATLADAARLIPGQKPTELLPLALRQDLKTLSEDEQKERLKEVQGLDPDRAFILHVGSSHRRKNREGILRIFAKIADSVNTQLVFAGKPLELSQRQLARVLNISDRIVEAGEVTNDQLAALYGKALAFLFPSRFEGFGWPIAEAQFCGCPVICSNRDPFPEVAGDGALMRDVEDETGFAEDIVRLATNPTLRATLIEKGFENVQRYSVEAMIFRYLALYEQVLRPQQKPNPATVHAAA
jgi:glycosyltransferase involved in cell wall biosynthesis